MNDIDLRRYDLNLLPVLDALLRTRSTTETARILARTQPGISRDLAKLRRLFRDPLLVRVRGQFEITAYAISLWPHLRRALEEARTILDCSTNFDPSSSKEVFHIGTNSLTESMMSTWMATHFPKIAPSASIRFTPVPGSQVPIEPLVNGQMHLAVGRFSVCPPSCSMQPLFTDRRVCVMRQGHPLQSKKISLEMLTKMSFVTTYTMHGLTNEIDIILNKHGLVRNFQFFVSNLAMAPHILLRSDCVTTMPRRAAELALSQYPLVISELPKEIPETTYSMIWSKRWDGVGSVSWLKEQVCHTFMPSAPVRPVRKR